MNRNMNLPAVQRIMREFEKESATMDMKDEMMGDAVDEAMDDDAEGIGEEEEGDAILKEVLDEIGVGLGQQVRSDIAAVNESNSCNVSARRDSCSESRCSSSSSCRTCSHR